MADSDAVLDIRDLTVNYRTVSGDVTAVDGVDLQVNRGEILGVAGQSGCGKSTMATTVLGLLKLPGYLAGGTAHFQARRRLRVRRPAAPTSPPCEPCAGNTWPTSRRDR